MCGIIGILPRPTGRVAPEPKDIVALLDAALSSTYMGDMSHALIAADQLLRGDAGIRTLAGNLSLIGEIVARLDAIDARHFPVEDHRIVRRFGISTLQFI